MPETMPTTTLTPPTATLVRPTTSLTAPVTSATKPVTDLDFSKFFASNSPLTPFTWYGSDYLKGWYTVGSVPPARTQFDALHNLSDKKDKYLLDYAKYHDDYEEWLKKFDTYLVNYDKYLKSTDDYLNNFANYLLNYAEYHDDYNAFLKSCIDFLNRVKAPIDSPAFTGTPTAPTPADSDNSKRIATTAFVQSLISALQSILTSHNSRIGTNRNDIDDLLSRIDDLESSGGGGGSGGGDDSGGESLSATFGARIDKIELERFAMGSGYFTISNGDDTFVIQYGTSGVTDYTVTFPISFPNACLAFVGIDGGVVTGNEHTYVCSVASGSKTQITAGGWNAAGNTWSPVIRMSWIAVGY